MLLMMLRTQLCCLLENIKGGEHMKYFLTSVVTTVTLLLSIMEIVDKTKNTKGDK